MPRIKTTDNVRFYRDGEEISRQEAADLVDGGYVISHAEALDGRAIGGYWWIAEPGEIRFYSDPPEEVGYR